MLGMNMSIIPTDGVVIRISDQVRFQRSLIINLKSIQSAIKSFLLHVLNAADKSQFVSNGHIYVSRLQVKREYAIASSLKSTTVKPTSSNDSNNEGLPSDGLIARRLGELTKLGVASLVSSAKDPSITKDASLLRQNIYIIEDIAPLASLPTLPSALKDKIPKRRTAALIYAQKELFSESDQLILLKEPSKISVHIHDGLFNGIIDAAQRLSHKDPRSKSIRAELMVAGSPLSVVATCSSGEGSEITMLSDQRAERCIRNYCQKEILYRKSEYIGKHGEDHFIPSIIPNFFVIDLHDLAVLMGLQVTSQNLDSIAAMMRRLNETTFRVDASKNAWFKDVFSLTSENKADVYEFRFLHNLDVAYDRSNVPDLFESNQFSSRPRFYSFSLDLRTFLSLAQTRNMIFLSHPDLVKERSGTIHRFSNWARAFVGSRDKRGLSNTWYSIRDLHRKLLPASRFDNFKTYFLRSLKKFTIESANGNTVYLVYGYYVYQKQQAGTHQFRFERDPNDPFVGDDSLHNALVRKNLLADLGDTEDDSIFLDAPY